MEAPLECHFPGPITEIELFSIFNVTFSFEKRLFGIVLSIKVNTFKTCN